MGSMDKYSPETGDLFGYGMDRPPMPPPPPAIRITKADLKRMEREQRMGVPPSGQQAAARRTDPSTSQDAAKRVNASGKVGKAERAVLRCLAEGGAANWDEISTRTGLRASTVSPRLKPLRERGLIRDTGQKAPGVSGSDQVLWEITEEGRAVL